MAVASKGAATDTGAGHLDEPISEAELTVLALAADPDEPIGPDAVPLSVYLSQVPGVAQVSGLLPSWYMPEAMATTGRRWRTPIILAIILAFVMIEAWGLCSTYGQVVLA